MNPLKIIILSLGALSVCFLYLSCAKNNPELVSPTDNDFNNKSFIQVYNASVGSTRNYVYVDASPVTGAPFAFGGTFPSTPANYAVTAGFREFLIKDTLSTSTQPQMSFSENFQASKYYTIFMYDTLNAIKQKTVLSNIVIPADTTARLRFANFIYNPVALPNSFDIFSVKRNANIFSNVRETEVTDFIPFASALTDTFYIRFNGNSANLQNVDTTGKPTIVNVQSILTPTRLRNYTMIFRGSYRSTNNKTSTGSAISSARTLSVISNN